MKEVWEGVRAKGWLAPSATILVRIQPELSRPGSSSSVVVGVLIAVPVPPLEEFYRKLCALRRRSVLLRHHFLASLPSLPALYHSFSWASH
jgi:hypothetical protein